MAALVVDRRPMTGAVPQSRVARLRPGASLPGKSSHAYSMSRDDVDWRGPNAGLVADASDNGRTSAPYEPAAPASHASLPVTRADC